MVCKNKWLALAKDMEKITQLSPQSLDGAARCSKCSRPLRKDGTCVMGHAQNEQQATPPIPAELEAMLCLMDELEVQGLISEEFSGYEDVREARQFRTWVGTRRPTEADNQRGSELAQMLLQDVADEFDPDGHLEKDPRVQVARRLSTQRQGDLAIADAVSAMEVALVEGIEDADIVEPGDEPVDLTTEEDALLAAEKMADKYAGQRGFAPDSPERARVYQALEQVVRQANLVRVEEDEGWVEPGVREAIADYTWPLVVEGAQPALDLLDNLDGQGIVVTDEEDLVAALGDQEWPLTLESPDALVNLLTDLDGQGLIFAAEGRSPAAATGQTRSMSEPRPYQGRLQALLGATTMQDVTWPPAGRFTERAVTLVHGKRMDAITIDEVEGDRLLTLLPKADTTPADFRRTAMQVAGRVLRQIAAEEGEPLPVVTIPQDDLTTILGGGASVAVPALDRYGEDLGEVRLGQGALVNALYLDSGYSEATILTLLPREGDTDMAKFREQALSIAGAILGWGEAAAE